MRTALRLSHAVAGLLALAMGISVPSQSRAGPEDRPRLYTNESYVEDVTRTPGLVLSDPTSVFAFVLASLPERVTVYPTENYYYFNFMHDGVRYAGNIRLDVMDRDQGKLHFAFFEDLAEWKDEQPVTYVVIDRSHGVSIEKVDELVYRVSLGPTTVLFALNDLRGVAPPAAIVGPDERVIGPVFDESGLRFFLIYNSRLKIFQYILDETVRVADRLFPAAGLDRILIGRRTGFAFYREHRLDRKILIGVFEGNSRVNNYFDGPFDQLPDNFIEGEALREAILDVEPGLAGRIDRLGSSPDGKDRYLIAPYAYYRTEEDLALFHRCATSSEIPREAYYACFVIDRDEPGAEMELPPQPRSKRPPKSGRTGARNGIPSRGR